MNRSVCSRASNASSQMLEELANRSMTAKILRAQGTFNDEQMRIIWNALGLYISRNLRMGRGVTIPKLGVFTFTPPEVRLKGLTNENERDQKPRLPIFLIQKDFVKGLPLKTAIFYHQQFGNGLRAYTSLGTTGDIPVTKMNLQEIASYANMTRDAAELGVNRIIKYISEKLISRQNINIQIPNVGQFISRNNLVAVKFNQFLSRDTRTVLSKSLDERKKKGNMNLTVDNLKKFAIYNQMKNKFGNSSNDVLEIDEKTKSFLETDFGLHINSARNPMTNTLSDFSRTFASRPKNGKTNLLKSSQMSRMTNSGFFTGRLPTGTKQFNMAFKILKQWAIEKCKDTAESFKDFCIFAGKTSQLMTAEDVWSACRKISLDINEQQAHELFRILDSNKDGFVTKEDWKKNITLNSNVLIEKMIKNIKSKKYTPSQVLEKMGISGISQVDVYTLKNGLKNLDGSLSNQQALFLSQYIGKGRSEIPVENILEELHLADMGNSTINQEWEFRFLDRLKKKIYERNIFEEELQSKLRIYDRNETGYIDQSNLKQVLADCGVNITLSELAKIVKTFPINPQNNKVHYQSIIERLNFIDGGNIKKPISEAQFTKIIQQKVINSKQYKFKLPISVRKLTSELQSTLFTQEEEQHLMKLVKKLDVNGNDEISQQDLDAYQEMIKPKKNYRKEDSCPLNMDKMLIKMRENSIEKRISYYDLFRKLDENRDGFITREEWMKNIEWILQISQDEKQLLFQHLDVSKIKMIDYKTFLHFMDGKPSSDLEVQKYDWVDSCFDRIKSWFSQSNLSYAKAFRIVDADGDSYISDQDLNQFLINTLKYERRELNHVRIQKVLKLMDKHTRGKVDEIDWTKTLSGNETNWVTDAKQQIGIIISKLYQSIKEAYNDISQGDKNIVYDNFKSWAMRKKVFSGFAANQESIKQFFSKIDTHKKGYLTQKDFISNFGCFNWKSEQTKEFIDKLKSQFKSAQDAFKAMNSYKNTNLSFESFLKFVEELFGNRFKKVDVKNIWGNICEKQTSLSLAKWRNGFGKEWTAGKNPIDQDFPKDDWKYEDFTIIKGTTIRSFENSYNETESMQSQTRKVVKTIKELLSASPKSLQQAFQKVDTQKVGRLNNIQFKKAIRSLNISLTSKQIDLLLNYCDYKVDTLINWRDFIKRFELSSDEQKLVSRIEPKMQLLSDLLHYYMVSPKDAFRNWNNPRTGFIGFEEFHKMLKDLYHRAAQKLPELAVIKDFFQYIDIRKDSELDFQEWAQTFRNFKPPSLVMGTVPATKQLMSRPHQQKELGKPIRDKQIPQFKNSPQYEDFVRFISRNRKYLQERIEESEGKDERLVRYETVAKILKETAESNHKNFTNNIIRHCIAFSMTGDRVDYRLLLDNCKERSDNIAQFPLKKVF